MVERGDLDRNLRRVTVEGVESSHDLRRKVAESARGRQARVGCRELALRPQDEAPVSEAGNVRVDGEDLEPRFTRAAGDAPECLPREERGAGLRNEDPAAR